MFALKISDSQSISVFMGVVCKKIGTRVTLERTVTGIELRMRASGLNIL